MTQFGHVQAIVVAYAILVLIVKPYIRKGLPLSRPALFHQLLFVGDDRLHLFVQTELFLYMLAGYIMYLDRNSIRSEETDILLSGARLEHMRYNSLL